MNLAAAQERVESLEVELGRARRDLAEAKRRDRATRIAAERRRRARLARRVFSEVARVYRADAESLREVTTRQMVEGRRFAWWLACEFGLSRQEVADALGFKRSTVLHAVWTVSRDVQAGRGPWLDLLDMVGVAA